MSQAEQLSLSAPSLPDVFVDEFRRLGLHWLHIFAGREDFVCRGRPTLEECAEYLFTQAHGRSLVDAATRTAR